MKDLSGYVFGLLTVRDPARYEGIDTVEIRLVEFCKTVRVTLGGFNQLPLDGDMLGCFQIRVSAAFYLTNDADKTKGYAVAKSFFSGLAFGKSDRRLLS
jgi:hypothetical protein